MIRNLAIIGLCYFLMISCSQSIKPEDLYGEWKYVKVENPYSNPPDSVASYELADQKPSIRFTRQNDLTIFWGGKTLSHGKFRLDGKMIRYKEDLGQGKSREFPFLVKKLTGNELIFETMEENATRVSAKR